MQNAKRNKNSGNINGARIHENSIILVAYGNIPALGLGRGTSFDRGASGYLVLQVLCGRACERNINR